MDEDGNFLRGPGNQSMSPRRPSAVILFGFPSLHIVAQYLLLDLPSRENCVFGYAEDNGGVGWGLHSCRVS